MRYLFDMTAPKKSTHKVITINHAIVFAIILPMETRFLCLVRSEVPSVVGDSLEKSVGGSVNSIDGDMEDDREDGAVDGDMDELNDDGESEGLIFVSVAASLGLGVTEGKALVLFNTDGAIDASGSSPMTIVTSASRNEHMAKANKLRRGKP